MSHPEGTRDGLAAAVRAVDSDAVVKDLSREDLSDLIVVRSYDLRCFVYLDSTTEGVSLSSGAVRSARDRAVLRSVLDWLDQREGG